MEKSLFLIKRSAALKHDDRWKTSTEINSTKFSSSLIFVDRQIFVFIRLFLQEIDDVKISQRSTVFRETFDFFCSSLVTLLFSIVENQIRENFQF